MFNGDSGGLEELISQSIQTKNIINDNHNQHSHDHSFNDDATINVTPAPINTNNDLVSHNNLYDPLLLYPPLETIDQPAAGFVLMPKLEQHINYGCNIELFSNNLNLIGLNLNLLEHHHHLHHMYFSLLGEDQFGKKMEAGVMNVSPRCQIEGCNADLTLAKHYHRRHKVCEFHSKASIVLTAGLTQRYCQQCSRFHILSEFDEGKRSCRKRLADHNRRRRKSSHHESTN